MSTHTVTTTQIQAFRAEAASAGDTVACFAADVALGREEPVTTDAAFEERFGGGGLDRSEREGIFAITDEAVARNIVVRAILDARAMEDDSADD